MTNQPDVELKPKPSEEQCDFCSSREVKWTYPCESFDLPAYSWGSVTDWAACEGCSFLIETGCRSVLLLRAVSSHPALGDLSSVPADMLTAILEMVGQMHAGFHTHRTGTRVPFVQTDAED